MGTPSGRRVGEEDYMKRNYPEHRLSAAVAEYLKYALPPDCYATSVGHGGGGKIRGALLQKSGVRPGFPDWLLIYNGHAFLIELKAPRGAVSADQQVCHAALRRAGCPAVHIARSLDDVEAALKEWGIPIRATTVI